jgi:hypothetical protein
MRNEARRDAEGVHSCEGEANIITGKQGHNRDLVSGAKKKRWEAPRTANITFLESGHAGVSALQFPLEIIRQKHGVYGG